MTEETVRAIFFKNYTRGLNEALIATEEEMRTAVLKETGEESETLPDIVGAIVRAQSRIDLFAGMTGCRSEKPVVPMSYIFHFDHLRKAMLDTVVYMRDNLQTVDPKFREWFSEEALTMRRVTCRRPSRSRPVCPAMSGV